MSSHTLNPREALRLIQIFVAVPLLVAGVYMFSPWYVVLDGDAAFGAISVVSSLVTRMVGLGMAVSGAGMILGAMTGNNVYARLMVWFGFIMYVMVVATRLVTIGFIPFVWVFQLALMLIAAVLALYVRRR